MNKMPLELEPIAKINISKRSFEDICIIDWSRCLFCQKKDKSDVVSSRKKIKRGRPQHSKLKSEYAESTAAGILSVKEAFEIRISYSQDKENDPLLARLVNVVDDLELHAPVWHKECRNNFTNKTTLARLKSKHSVKENKDEKPVCRPASYKPLLGCPTPSPLPEPNLSGNVLIPNKWNKCLFCQKFKREVIHQLQSMDTCRTIFQGLEYYPDTRSWLNVNSPEELLSAKALYHMGCFRKFKYSLDGLKKSTLQTGTGDQKDAFEMLTEKLDEGLKRGSVYSIDQVTCQYNNLLRSVGQKNETDTMYPRQKLKQKLEKHYGDSVQFVRQQSANEPMLLLSSSIPSEKIIHTLVSHDQEIMETVHELGKEKKDSDLELYMLGTMIRNEILRIPNHTSYEGLDEEHARQMIPDSLFQLLDVIFGNSTASDTSAASLTKILSIGQDVVAAVGKRTPKHISLGLTIHQATRSKLLIQLLHGAGHCTSYETIERIDTTIAEKQLENFRSHEVVIPEQLNSNQFVLFAADNIDILEHTVDGRGTFHATQMAAFQRGPQRIEEESMPPINRNRVLKDVPPSFHALTPSGMPSSHPQPIFSSKEDTIPEFPDLPDLKGKDLLWCFSRMKADNHLPGWTPFNKKISVASPAVTTVAVLPLILAPAHEFDTVWTVINRSRKISQQLGQPYSVVTFDEALYWRAKELIWHHKCSDAIVLLGGFHMAMNFSQVIGQHYKESGLEDILIESGILSGAVVAQIMNGKAWNGTIRTHKLMFEALWRVFWKSFTEWGTIMGIAIPDISISVNMATAFLSDDPDKLQNSLEDLSSQLEHLPLLFQKFEEQNSSNPTFIYWLNYMKMVCVLLNFIRAEREGDWNSHLTSVKQMLPWFAIYDHRNYFKWGSVYLKDMLELPLTAINVHKEFLAGNFVVKWSENHFNQVAVDQALEFVNRAGKVSGGLVGITREDSARDRWSLTYNIRADISHKTYSMFGLNETVAGHWEDGEERNSMDETCICKLVEMLSLHDVFGRQSTQLRCITTEDIAPASVKKDLLSAYHRGRDAVEELYKTRLSVNPAVPFDATVHKHSTKTMANKNEGDPSTATPKPPKSEATKIVRRLLVATNSGRKVDLRKMLQHELTPVPLALACEDGTLRPPIGKSELTQIVAEGFEQKALPASSMSTCTVIDGMALVQGIGRPKELTTFGDLGNTFCQSVLTTLSRSTRVDVVFDHYQASSIKEGTRVRRRGSRLPIRRVISSDATPLPHQWNAFIDMVENKADLCQFLSRKICTLADRLPDNKVLVTGGGFENSREVWSSSDMDLSALQGTHEEADTRILLHAKHACLQGYQRLIVCATDTDVLILLLHFRSRLQSMQEIWMRAGTRSKRKIYPIHNIATALGESVCTHLPAFHSITGTDTTSKFHGHSKKSGWKVFKTNPGQLARLGTDITLQESEMKAFERFVVSMYAPSSKAKGVSELRAEFFHKRSIENLPPTSDALGQHVLHAHYQASVWKQAINTEPTLPTLLESGWNQVDGKLIPTLMTIPAKPTTSSELVECSCSTQCSRGNCSCRLLQTCCTLACKCKGDCLNPWNTSLTSSGTNAED